ncbi:MAG TPA: hypothetical protein DE045_12205 [Oceanospirillaceae bacterium]|nr:hypothetical protein [Oceanospirillaceae bacterium]
MLRVFLMAVLVALAPLSVADGHWSNWSDKTLCRVLKSDQSNAGYRAEAVDRGLDCVAPSAVVAEQPTRLIDDLIATGKVTIMAATDVSEKTINNTKKWMNVAAKTWFTKQTPASNYYYPIVITLVGQSTSAANVLDDQLCEEISKKSYSTRLCGRYLADYARDGGAGINSSRMNDKFHFMVVGTTRRTPSDDLGDTILHEAFHIYQLSQITTKNRDLIETKRGRRSGDHSRDVPWWTEGTATYLSYLTYSRQPRIRQGYLKNMIRCELGDCEGHRAPRIDEYFELGTKLYNIDYGNNRMIAYRVGALFAAYLINDVGEDKLFDYYEAEDELGFETSFETHFGRPYRDYINQFEVFLKQPLWKILKIIP